MEEKVEIAQELLHELERAAMDALPNETGGLLIGWREESRVIIVGWLQLNSGNPRANRFEIDSKKATIALRRYLSSSSDPLEGYVGAWHTHPALTPPSDTDVATFGASAAATAAPLAFIVLATDGLASMAHVAWSGRVEEVVTVKPQNSITLKKNGSSR